jgi:hypothetical protein
MNWFLFLVFAFPLGFQDSSEINPVDGEYLARVEERLIAAEENALQGKRDKEANKIHSARDAFIMWRTHPTSTPYTLWYDVLSTPGVPTTGIAVYWIDTSWTADVIRIKLKNGGEIRCRLDERYVKSNKELYEAGEGMFGMVELGTETIQIHLDQEGIVEVVVEH